MINLFIPFEQGYSVVQQPSTFSSYFSEGFQRDFISLMYPRAFNGSTVRLESLSVCSDGSILLGCSPLDFYSFLGSNLLVGSIELNSHNFTNYITCSYLANSIAVSVLVYDSNYVLLTKRSSKVALSPHIIGVSATGGVTMVDLQTSDCLRSAVVTEVKEELGLELEFKQVQVIGLYISQDKLQPVAICFVKVSDLTILDLRGSDTTFEVESFIKVPFSELTALNLKGSTDTSRFQLDYFITENSVN